MQTEEEKGRAVGTTYVKRSATYGGGLGLMPNPFGAKGKHFELKHI